MLHMKLTLNPKELLELVNKVIGNGYVTEVEIANPGASMANKIRYEMRGFNLQTNKVDSIKRLREILATMGIDNYSLVSGKYAVEHFDDFLKFIEHNGVIPEADSNGVYVKMGS